MARQAKTSKTSTEYEIRQFEEMFSIHARTISNLKNGFYENFKTLFLWVNLFPFRFVGDCFSTFLVRDGASSSSFSFSRSRFGFFTKNLPSFSAEA